MSATPSQLGKGNVSRSLPNPMDDASGAERIVRLGRYGDMKVESSWPNKYLLADEGAYFVAGMLPGATSLQIGIMATYVAASCPIVLGNSSSQGPSGKRIYLDYIRFRIVTAGTSGTDLKYAVVLDSVDRAPTTLAAVGSPANLTAYLSPVFNTNMDSNTVSIAKPYFTISTAAGTPPTVPAAGANARTIVGEGSLRTQIVVVKDEYILTFGGPDFYATTGPVLTTASKVVQANPPVVIGPGQFLLVNLWSSSNVTAGNALSALDMGWVEK